jgi:Putative zinc-finger
MQKLVPEDSIPTTGHPSPEELAAYIDGNLGKEEAARVTGHLASCEDCYDVYSMSVGFLLANEPGPDTNVVPFPTRKLSQRRWPVATFGEHAASWRSAAAAVVLLALSGGIGGYFFLAPPPALMPVQVAGPVQGNAEVSDKLWLGPTSRGGGEEEKEVALDPASFQMGVQLVNLQVRLAANDGRGSEDVVARILQVLETQYLAEDLKKAYKNITFSIENKTPARSLLGRTSQLAQQTRETLDAPHVDFGQWVEAGYLASLSQSPTFFQQSESRKFLRRLRWRDKLHERLGLGDTELDPITRASLDRVSEIISKRDLRPADYDEIEQQLRKILDHYYPET